MSRGIEVLARRFPLLLEQIPVARGKAATETKLLYVFSSGEVFTSSVKRDRNDYLFSNPGKGRNHQPEIVSQNQLKETLKVNVCMDDLVAHSSLTKCECKLHFHPIPDFRQAHAELVKNRLLIFGMLHHGVPSFGIYSITCDDNDVKFQLVYTDSILAVADVALTETHFLVIPRLITGCVAAIEAPPANPGDYRLIQAMTIVGYNCPEINHIAAGTKQGDWTWAAWSDERTPSLSVWKVPDGDTQWKGIFFEFTEPAWIRTVVFNPAGNRLGIVLMTGTRMLACLWDVDRDGKLVQENYVCENIGELLAVRWQPATKDASEAFVVIGTTGMVEVAKDHDVNFWPQQESPVVLFEDVSPLARFYINATGELKVMNTADMSDKMSRKKIPKQRYGNLTLVKVRIDGEKRPISGLHLRRCGNCLAPLVCPLLSVSQDGSLRQFYCSKKCQMEHWPIYEVTMQPDLFEIEEP